MIERLVTSPPDRFPFPRPAAAGVAARWKVRWAACPPRCNRAHSPGSGISVPLVLLALLAGCGGIQGERPLREVTAESAPARHTAYSTTDPDDGAHSHGAHDHGTREQATPGHGDDHSHAHGTARNGLAGDAELRVEHEERTGRIQLTVGPFLLGPGTPVPVMLIPPVLMAALPVSGWVVGLEVELFDSAGLRVPQALMHHSGVMLTNRRDLFRPLGQRLAGAGKETRPVRLPWPLGVPITAGEEVMVYAMLHNGTPTDYGPVYLRFNLETSGMRFLEVRPFFIDVSPPPGPASWDLPPGRSTRSWEGSPAVDGRILALGGHLHRYGVELRLEDAATGEVLHRLEPELAPDGGIANLPQRFFLPLGLRLRRDRTYRIVAVYDNPTGATIPLGAMGSFGGVVMPSGGAWPATDPDDPLFQQDIDWYRAEEERAAAHHVSTSRR